MELKVAQATDRALVNSTNRTCTLTHLDASSFSYIPHTHSLIKAATHLQVTPSLTSVINPAAAMMHLLWVYILSMHTALPLHLTKYSQRLQQADSLPYHHEASATHDLQGMLTTLTA